MIKVLRGAAVSTQFDDPRTGLKEYMNAFLCRKPTDVWRPLRRKLFKYRRCFPQCVLRCASRLSVPCRLFISLIIFILPSEPHSQKYFRETQIIPFDDSFRSTSNALFRFIFRLNYCIASYYHQHVLHRYGRCLPLCAFRSFYTFCNLLAVHFASPSHPHCRDPSHQCTH